MRGPDFVIAGGHKCATTSLHASLAAGGQVCMSRQKEPHYLIRGAVARRLPNVVTEPDQYEQLWTDDHRLRGEASVLYLTFAREFVSSVMEEMDVPPRVVVSVRDPIARAYSSYLDVSLKNPDESAPNFSSAVERELERGPWRVDGEGTPTLRHLALSRYSSGIATLREAFGRDRVLVVRFEEFTREPAKILNEISDFLGVPAGDPIMHANEGGLVWRSSVAEQFLRHRLSVPLRRMVARSAPRVHASLRSRATARFSQSAPAMDPETRAQLVKLFATEKSEMIKLLGTDLPQWLS